MDYIIALAGLALVGSPWLFRFSTNNAAMSSSVILGVIVLVIAGYRALAKDKGSWEEWTVGVAGVLAIIAPFVFGVSQAAIWSMVILGVIVAALAAYQLFAAAQQPPRVSPQAH